MGARQRLRIVLSAVGAAGAALIYTPRRHERIMLREAAARERAADRVAERMLREQADRALRGQEGGQR